MQTSSHENKLFKICSRLVFCHVPRERQLHNPDSCKHKHRRAHLYKWLCNTDQAYPLIKYIHGTFLILVNVYKLY